MPLTGKHNKGFGAPEKSRITEQFNDHHEKIKVDVYTERLDDEQFNFSVKKFGFTGVHLNHFYSAESDGARFYAETIVGLDVLSLDGFLTGLFFPSCIRERLQSIGLLIMWRRLEDQNPLFPCCSIMTRSLVRRTDRSSIFRLRIY